jgi:hypothetical protein
MILDLLTTGECFRRDGGDRQGDTPHVAPTLSL